MRTFRSLVCIALAMVFLGADAPPLDPDLRAAAPEGWIVLGKREGGYEWLRFAASEALEGEDYKDEVITLYRLKVRVDPSEAGKELAELKVSRQKTSRREEVELVVDDVKWKGIQADYLSEDGTSRRERYLYTGHHDETLYMFWDRGPAEGWEAGAKLREETLKKVSRLLAGRDEGSPGGDGEG